MHACCQQSGWAEDCTGYPVTGAADSCELPCGYGDPNPGPHQGKEALFIAGPPLKSQFLSRNKQTCTCSAYIALGRQSQPSMMAKLNSHQADFKVWNRSAKRIGGSPGSTLPSTLGN